MRSRASRYYTPGSSVYVCARRGYGTKRTESVITFNMQVLPGERGEKFHNEFAVMAPLKFHSWRAAPRAAASFLRVKLYSRVATRAAYARSVEERRLLPDRDIGNKFSLLCVRDRRFYR